MANVYKGRNGSTGIGRVGADGIIYNKINTCSPVGRIDTPENYIYDSQGNFMGRIDRDGKVYKSRTGIKRCVGRIDYNGFLYNTPEGHECIAHVQRGEEMYGAAYFLLHEM